MKKELIGTTALVGAGLLAGSGLGQGAVAADPLNVTVGGYLQASLEYRDSDDSAGEPGANLQDFGVYEDGEVQITAATTLDNGLGVKARVEYEAQNQGGTTKQNTAPPATHAHDHSGGTILDEAWVEFAGAFGQLRLGRDDDVAYTMQYQAPVGAYQIGLNTTTFAVPAVGGNAAGAYPTTYISATSDGEKIIWFSPRVAGFQLGLSYAPDDSRLETSPETGFFAGAARVDNEVGESEDVFSVGLNFVETLNDVDFALAGGYNHGSLEADGVNADGQTVDDRRQWSAGMNVGFAGFTIGASIAHDNMGLDNDVGKLTWDAGITYGAGPFTVGFTYLASAVDQHGKAGGSAGDDELESFQVSGTYNVGPGADLWGGVKFYEYEDDLGAAASENEGYIIAIGTSVSF